MATTQHQPSPAVEPVTVRQYSLARILGTWAAAALPMAALAWLVIRSAAGWEPDGRLEGLGGTA
jgi:hypothetical protein